MSVIRSFRNRGTADIWHGYASREARRTLPEPLHAVAVRKLDMLNQAVTLNDLRAPPNNRLEALKGDRKGTHAIRINDQYRVCFIWTAEGPGDVEIVDYH